jgi:hypothetical protein
MKVKVFTIRLTSEKMVSDQKVLNDFLETVKFVKSATHFVEAQDVSYWSVMVHFEDLYETKKSEDPQRSKVECKTTRGFPNFKTVESRKSRKDENGQFYGLP